MDDFVNDVANKSRPSARFGQLRRTCQDMVQALADIDDHRFDLISRGMGKREQQTGLAGVLGQATDTGEQHRAAGDRFQACFRVRKAHVPTPPVVDQRHRPRREVAALQILGGITAPAPLILEFIESIFAIGPIPVQLADGFCRVVSVADQDGVFPEFGRLGRAKELQFGLRVLRARVTD